MIALGPDAEECQAKCEGAFAANATETDTSLMQLYVACAQKNPDCSALWACIGLTIMDALFSPGLSDDDNDDGSDDDDDDDDDDADGDEEQPDLNLEACYGSCELTEACYNMANTAASCKADCDETGGGIYTADLAACYEAYRTHRDCSQAVDCLSNLESRR